MLDKSFQNILRSKSQWYVPTYMLEKPPPPALFNFLYEAHWLEISVIGYKMEMLVKELLIQTLLINLELYLIDSDFYHIFGLIFFMRGTVRAGHYGVSPIVGALSIHFSS